MKKVLPPLLFVALILALLAWIAWLALPVELHPSNERSGDFQAQAAPDVATPRPSPAPGAPASAVPSQAKGGVPSGQAPQPATTRLSPAADAAIAPQANYAVNDPEGVLSPITHIVANAVEIERRELPPDQRGRPGRLRLVRSDNFKYPHLRVEERFGKFSNGMVNPFPDVVVSVADHVMAQVDPAMDDKALERLAEQMGGRVRERLLRPGLVLLELPSATLDAVPDALASLQSLYGVRFAEPDWVVGHLGQVTPDDPEFGQLWAMQKIGAPDAWEITTGRQDVLVAVIDSGVDYTHLDLKDNMFYNTLEAVDGLDNDGNGFVDDIRGWDFYSSTNNPMDENRHGTHVAGTIAAVGNNNLGVAGVAWQTRIMPLRFLNASGAGTTSGGINAIAYSTIMGVRLTNNSWGGGAFSRALYDTIAEVRNAGILFIAASGNSGEPDPGFPARYGNAGLPEGLPPLSNVISVAASSNDSADSLAAFSNLRAHIAAPGVGIFSTSLDNTYESLSGTSMASPHVAGAAALLLAVQPDIGFAALKENLLGNVDNRSSDPKYDLSIQSRGRLNINAVLRNLNIPIMVRSGMTLAEFNGPRAGNGVINPGEQIEMTVSLRSVGLINTQNVTAILSTTSPHVTITQPTGAYGDFNRYETRTSAQAFVFSVNPATPTPLQIPLTLTISATGGYQWVERIMLTAYTSVDAGGIVRHVDGTPFGNATVSYAGPFSGSVTTGPDGRYSFEMVDGAYKIFAEAPGVRRTPSRLHNAPPGNNGLDFVLGSGIINASVPAIEAEARPGGRVEFAVDLANAGSLPLNWRLRETEYGFEFFSSGLSDPARPDLHWKEIRHEFGGSGTRIHWWDLFSPVPITDESNQQTGWRGMDRWSYGPLSFNFEFPFYGRRFSSARVNNAGWLGFGSVNRSVFYNAVSPMPDPSFMDYKIAFQWALRDPGSSNLNGPVQKKPNLEEWQSGGSSIWDPFRDSQHACAKNWDAHTWVFTWNQWASPFPRTPPEFDTGQIELRSDGSIIVRYLDYQKLPTAGNFTFGGPYFFSAGLQDGSGSRGINPIFRAYTEQAPTPGSVLVMRPAVAASWILPDRTSGTLASLRGQGKLKLTLDAGQLPPGVYESSIVIDSDDTTGNGALRIPITFTVSETAPSLVLTAPGGEQSIPPGTNLPVTAVFDGAGAPDGAVELLRDDEVLATLPSGGGTFLWENLPGGFHNLSARVKLAGGGHTVYAPVRKIQAGKGLRLQWSGEEFPVFSNSLIEKPSKNLEPPVVSHNLVSAERFDITPVTFTPGQFSWWGDTSTRDPFGRDGTFNVGNSGRELRLTTNNYRKFPLSHTITPNTVLEFEFRSFTDPVDRSSFVCGLGFSENNTLNPSRVFRLLGDRNWGINAFNGRYPYSNSLHSGRRPWVRYRIPVGQFYTGSMQSLVFVAHSLDPNFNMYFRDVDAAFRNIRIYESTESDVFSYLWTFNDTARTASGPEIWRSYFSPGTKQLSVTVTDGAHSATATRTLELPGRAAFRVAVNFQPANANVPAGFVPDTGEPFGNRGNDLSYGWDTTRSAQIREDNWLAIYGMEQAVTRIRAGNGASWRIAVPAGIYNVTAHVGASTETSNTLLRANGQTILDRNVPPQGYAEGTISLPVTNGEIVVSSHRDTTSLLYLEIERIDDLKRPPVAGFTASPQSGDAPHAVQFDAADSFDSDGSIVGYLWDFGNGFTATGARVSHTYMVPGVHAVTLQVTDNDGLVGLHSLGVLVEGAALPAILVTPPVLPPLELPVFGEPPPRPRRELSEGGGSLQQTVVLASAPTHDVIVNIGSGNRVVASPAALVFTPANWSQPQTVQISALNNEVVDGDDLVVITATATSTDTGYNGIEGPPFDVWAMDDDAFGSVQFTGAGMTVDEDDGGLSVQVSRTGGQSGVITAQFTTLNGSALGGEDFIAVSGNLTWAHNETGTKTIGIGIVDDSSPEPPETFHVRLTGSTNAIGGEALDDQDQFAVTILDDDNVNPAIVLQSPSDGASHEAGDVVPLTASVTSNTATISQVRFYVNGVLVGTQNSPVSGSLYRLDWVASIGATSWHVEATDSNNGSSVSESRALAVAPVFTGGPGGFLREVFRNLNEGTITALTGSKNFPDAPALFDFIESGALEYLDNTNNYGTRLRAYFVPPKTGSYRFYSSARTRAEVWLSTNERPENRIRILNPDREDDPGMWNHAAQRSEAIPLVAGRRYYLEALHVAGSSGTRHIQVGVELPGGQMALPVPVGLLRPFAGVKIEVSIPQVNVPEGGTAAVQVRLRQQPPGNLSLQASLTDPQYGGAGIEILGTGHLTFTPDNWNHWQTLNLYAATDSDMVDGRATLRLALDNGTWWDIPVWEIDAELNHPPTVTITSPTVPTVNLPGGVGLWLAAEAEDPDNDALALQWQKVSGPGSVTFDNASHRQTGVTFSSTGEYVLRVTANDGEFSAAAEVNVRANVSAHNTAGINSAVSRNLAVSSNGTGWALSGGGAGLREAAADSISFAYVEMKGDFQIFGRLGSLTPTSSSVWGFTSLMVRESLAPGARMIFAGAHRSSTEWTIGRVGSRTVPGAAESGSDVSPPNTGLYRITRTGNVFQVSRYQQEGSGFFWYSNNQTVTMPETVLVGISVHSSDSPSGVFTASWTDITIPGNINLAPMVNAGPDATIELSANHTLSGNFSASYLPKGPLQTVWEKVSGPGAVLTSTPDSSAPDLTVSFELPGGYVLRYLASNGEAVTFDDVTITVRNNESFPPMITQSPQAQTVVLGGSAIFTVLADASPEPTYQWYHNNIPVPGATSASLQIDNLRFEDEGLYHVRAANSEGFAESTPVLLQAALPAPQPILFARVNFQTNTAAPSGWLRDIGQVYGDRGNGFHYGWSGNNTSTTRQRNNGASPSPQHDTFIHMQRDGNFTWSMAVPNGNYTVRVVCGDADFNDSVFRVNVENTLVVSGTPTSANRWVEGNAIVTVADSRLNVTNGSGASNNKICFIEIHNIPASVGGYDEWAMQLPAGLRGRTHNHQSVSNLLRYAMGGNADTPVSSFQLSLQPSGQGLALRFPSIDDPRLTYEIWASQDLVNWGLAPVWSITGKAPESVSVPGNPPRQFLRLKVLWNGTP